MLLIQLYVGIGITLAILAQFTLHKPKDALFDRVGGGLLCLVIWPLVLFHDGRELFGLSRRENEARREALAYMNSQPPLYGGDGLSEASPVIVNCAAMSTAALLIDSFISKRHGPVDSAWSRGIAMTLASDVTRCGMVRAVTIRLADGSEATYFFDLSRPVDAMSRLLSAAKP